MTKLGERLLKSAKEAQAIARGEHIPGAVVHAPIELLLPSNLVAAIDAYMLSEERSGEGPSTMPETIRFILGDWLTGHGYLRHRKDPEGAN